MKQIIMLLSFLLTTTSVIAADDDCNKLPMDANDVKPLLIGQEIPSVTLKNIGGKDVDLKAEVAKKPTLIIFYRGGWCPYCNVHLGELAKIEPKLLEMGFQVIAISPDQAEYLKESKEKNDVKYTLLSDSNVDAIKKFGLAFQVDDETLKKYEEYGIDLEKNSGQSHNILPVPAAFLVSQSGHIEFSHVAPDYTTRVNTKTLLTAAENMRGAR